MTTINPVTEEPLGYPGGPGIAPPRFFDARQTVISQYASSPVLLSLVDGLNYAFDRQDDFNNFYDLLWNVDTAEGFGLDVWGRIVGVGRGLYIPDSQYLGFSDSDGSNPFGYGVFYGGGSFTPNYRMTDIVYRRVILAKAALNITDGSIPAINSIMMALFPDYGNVYVRDNADMTMTFVFGAVPSTIDYAIVTQSGVIPKPAGVSFDVEHP